MCDTDEAKELDALVLVVPGHPYGERKRVLPGVMGEVLCCHSDPKRTVVRVSASRVRDYLDRAMVAAGIEGAS